MRNEEASHEWDQAGGRRRRRAGRPKEDPRPGDLKPQPQDRWGELYCVYKLYDRHGTLLYVGETDDVVSQLTEHQRGTRLQWGGRLDDRSRWWADVVHVTVEHLPPGTTAWEAKLYARSQMALGPVHNTELPDRAEAARSARLEAEQRDAEQHDRARQLHARHDGVTRQVRPTLAIVPRFPGSGPPLPSEPPEPAPVVGAHDIVRPPAGAGGRERQRDGAANSREPALVGGAHQTGPSAQPDGGTHATVWSATALLAPPTTPEPEADPVGVDDPLAHQGRYLLLTMAGVLLGIVVLSLSQLLS